MITHDPDRLTVEPRKLIQHINFLIPFGLVLLGICALLMTGAALNHLNTIADKGSIAHAQILADGVAIRVQRAISAGIPVKKLEGLDVFFTQRMQTQPGIAALILLDTTGKVIFQSPVDAEKLLNSGKQVTATAVVSGNPVAKVVLVWRKFETWQLLFKWVLPLAAIVVIFALVAAEVLKYSVRQGVLYRDLQISLARERIEAGNFDWQFSRTIEYHFDRRMSWVSAELRYLNELYLRVQRLVQSLRQTEPDAYRRADLDALLLQAKAADNFRFAEGLLTLDAGNLSQGKARLRGLFVSGLISLGLGGGAILVVGGWNMKENVGLFVLLIISLAGLLWVAWYHLKLTIHRPFFAAGSLIGGLVVGPGLLLSFILIFNGNQSSLTNWFFSAALFLIVVAAGFALLGSTKSLLNNS